MFSLMRFIFSHMNIQFSNLSEKNAGVSILQDTWHSPSLPLFTDSWKDTKDSFPVMKQPLRLCFQHLVLNKSGSAAGRAQAR